MDVRNFLSAMFAAVDDQAIAILTDAFIAGNLARDGEHSAHGGLIIGGKIINRGNVAIRDDQHMSWPLRIDIPKGGDEFVLIQHGGRQFLADDLAENSFFNHGDNLGARVGCHYTVRSSPRTSPFPASSSDQLQRKFMGNRLSKIYTRTGDDGTTGLGDGSRTDKDGARVAAYGTTDELNSVIGLVLALEVPDSVGRVLHEIQHHLFDLGGELCIPGHQAIQQTHIDWLEQTLDHFNSDLPPLKDFILPGGSQAAASCHLARTVCRRAERLVVSLQRVESVPPFSMKYLNRLSDLLFVIARVLARHQGGSEVLWQKDRAPIDLGS